MDEWTRLQRYVGFNGESASALAALAEHIEPHLTPITERFYDAIHRDDAARALFSGPDQVARLKGSMRKWIRELLTGPHDAAYREKRQVIGRVHVRIGMPHYYMMTAMNLLREDLARCAASELPASACVECVQALHKIMDLELAIMLGTYIEERERRELEDFRALIVNNIPVTVFFLDENARVVTDTFCHPRICRNLHPTDALIYDVIHAPLQKAAGLRARLEEMAALATPADEVVLPRLDAVVDGERVSARFTLIDLRHPIARTMIYCEDLTDIVRSETRRRDAENLAKIGTMAATVAHEIRNPLAGISATIQVVSDTMDDDDGRKGPLEKVREQTLRLGALVGDMLNFARPVAPIMADCALRPAVVQGVADVDVRAANGRKTEIDGVGDAFVDAHLLARVVLNIVQNAWQAGAEHVRVSLSDGRVEIVDDGPGIALDQQARIFEDFMTTKTRGTGLGLPIAKRAIEAMGGELTVESKPGAGATFRLRLAKRSDRASPSGSAT